MHDKRTDVGNANSFEDAAVDRERPRKDTDILDELQIAIRDCWLSINADVITTLVDTSGVYLHTAA
jgi:hypothetical protein